MAFGSESMVRADFVTELEELIVSKFDDLIALRAMQVVVGRIAVIVLEGAAIGQPEFSEQAGLDEKAERPIDRRTAHLMPRRVQVSRQFIRVEMLVCIEDMTYQNPPRVGQLVPPNFEKLTKFLDGVFQQ